MCFASNVIFQILNLFKYIIQPDYSRAQYIITRKWIVYKTKCNLKNLENSISEIINFSSGIYALKFGKKNHIS